jgi:hypothetical protein
MVHRIFNGTASTIEVILLRVRREDAHVAWGGKDLGEKTIVCLKMVFRVVSGDGVNQLNLQAQ